MNEYQQEQYAAFQTVIRGLAGLSRNQAAGMEALSQPYLQFRRQLDDFQSRHLADVCTRQCYRSHRSACCSKDGIVVFFADVVINALVSSVPEIDELVARLRHPLRPDKCIYLGRDGCSWKVRPIVCAMFLCDRAHREALTGEPELQRQWVDFERRRKTFTWPDRPVLFDKLEQSFMRRGFRSTLMFLNTGPGLLRVKKQAGLL